MFQGIDISNHNSHNLKIDWQTVKDNNNIQFVLLRAGYGQNNIDKSFEYNIDALNRIGIPVGIYWDSMALTPEAARQEAKNCLNAIKKKRVEYPVIIKFDRNSIEYALQHGKNLSRAEIHDIIISFVEEIRSANYFPMVYANQDYRKNMFAQNLFDDIDAWYAMYARNADAPYGIWQYKTNGSIKGIEGPVGLNKANLDYKFSIKKLKLNNLKRRN